ncbi:hypothetical protein BGP_6456 [Beggiatoa sp. PS]|nr:hypothetical protein BGP_6456 [Beggiatoa sp. PS]
MAGLIPKITHDQQTLYFLRNSIYWNPTCPILLDTAPLQINSNA